MYDFSKDSTIIITIIKFIKHCSHTYRQGVSKYTQHWYYIRPTRNKCRVPGLTHLNNLLLRERTTYQLTNSIFSLLHHFYDDTYIYLPYLLPMHQFWFLSTAHYYNIKCSTVSGHARSNSQRVSVYSVLSSTSCTLSILNSHSKWMGSFPSTFGSENGWTKLHLLSKYLIILYC